MIRKNVRKTAWALTLMLCVPGAALACEGADCAAPGSAAKVKPLDIMQFMREQAASTRAGERRHHAAKTVPAKHKQATRRTAAANSAPDPAPLASDAAASFASHSVASQDPLPVPVLAREEFNTIDSSAAAPSPETTGGPAGNDPNVQVVAAAEFNEIDRKADEASPFPTVEVPVAAEAAKPDAARAPTTASWLQWLWSAVTGTFTALAAAVRQLIHV